MSARHGYHSLLDQHIADRRPIPGHSGSTNLFAMALTLGCSRKEIERHRAKIGGATAIVDLEHRSWFDMPATAQLDGRPWIRAAVGSRRLPDKLSELTTMPQAQPMS
ncbi:hypothetical protein K7711_19400 [Nocardia sp. CA2R105]|uniref:hypothetical protein n=1 Tax=Nocardia coffeae TaxID=2873381 RepID=UPI001CA7B4B7|nr:hypothetical protein [Nocardia coffeae]MBY8858654.1 hypothetical protein [Nocardia coffeae]